MSLLRRIQQDGDRRAQAQTAQRLSEEQRASDMVAAVLAAVEAHLEQVAAELGEPIVPLRLHDGYPQYADLGGVIISVRPYQPQKTIEINPNRPGEVLDDFVVHAVATDRRSGVLTFCLIGRLRWLSYSGISDSVGRAPSYMDFTTARIAYLLTETKRPEERPRCGKPVVITPASDADLMRAIESGKSPTAPCRLGPGHDGKCDHNPSTTI